MSEREPITAELRELMGGVEPRVDEDGVVTAKYVTPEAWGEFAHRCDAIDAVHAGLERENAELRQRVAVLDNRSESMHDGGRITDELRAWWVRKFPVIDQELHKDFTAIADRIDAEHESACAEAYGNGVMSVPIALDESAWVELPKDVDGVPIHIGDVMEWPTTHETFEVVGIGDGTLFYIEDGSEQADWTGASTKNHHHATTVEDVLTKFGIDWEYETNCEDRAALLAEYAAKLRLAGDAE